MGKTVGLLFISIVADDQIAQGAIDLATLKETLRYAQPLIHPLNGCQGDICDPVYAEYTNVQRLLAQSKIFKMCAANSVRPRNFRRQLSCLFQ